MIKYTYKKRELIIPDGIGNINNGGCSECILENKSVQQDFEVATYRPNNGYNGIGRITVDAGGYGQTKWNEGVAYAKGQMAESAFTENGIYENSDGWNKITISVSGGTDPEVIEQAYESGITKGMADQKALLVSTAITANGIYTKEDGFSAVTVNIPWAKKFIMSFILNSDEECRFANDIEMPSYLEISHRQMRTKAEALNMVFVEGGKYLFYLEYDADKMTSANTAPFYILPDGDFRIDDIRYTCINCNGPDMDTYFQGTDTFQICGNPKVLGSYFFYSSRPIDGVVEWPASVEYVAKDAFKYILGPTHSINRIFSHSSTLVIEDNPEWAAASGTFECPRGFDYTDVLEALGSGWTANPVL